MARNTQGRSEDGSSFNPPPRARGLAVIEFHRFMVPLFEVCPLTNKHAPSINRQRNKGWGQANSSKFITNRVAMRTCGEKVKGSYVV